MPQHSLSLQKQGSDDYESISASGSLSISQEIYNFGGIEKSIAYASLYKEYQTLSWEQDNATLLSSIFQNVLESRILELTLEKTEYEIKNQEIEVEIQTLRYKNGTGDITDLNNAIISQNNLYQSKTGYINSLKKKRIELLEYTNLPYEKITLPTFTLMSKENFIRYNLQTLSQESNINVEKNLYGQTKTDYLPSISVSGQLSLSRTTDESDFSNGYSLGVLLSYPLSYTKESSIEEKQLSYMLEKLNLNKLKQNLESSYEQIVTTIKDYKEKNALIQKTLSLCNDLLEVNQVSSSAGYTSQYDLEILKALITTLIKSTLTTSKRACRALFSTKEPAMTQREDIQDVPQKPESSPFKALIYVVIVLALLGGGSYFFYFSKSEMRQPTKVDYVTQKVERRNLSIQVTATRNLEPTNSVDIEIEVSGTVNNIYVDYNDKVTKGQILASIDTAKLEATLNASKTALVIAKANLTQSEASLKNYKSKYDRAQEMHKKSQGKYLSTSEMDDCLYDYESAKATVATNEAKVTQAESEVKTAQENLDKAVVKSSINGIVLDKSVEIGQTVTATMSTPTLFTLAQDLSKMDLIINVDEADVGQVKEGQKVTFSVDAYPTKEFNGVIRQIRLNPQEVNNVITCNTVVTVDNNESLLKPGMVATAQIITQYYENTLAVPNAALRFTPKVTETKSSGFSFGPPRRNEKKSAVDTSSQKSVWLLSRDFPQKVEVTTGETDGKWTLLTDQKLREGDDVITSQKSVNE